MKIRKKPNVMASCQTEIDAVTHTHTQYTQHTHRAHILANLSRWFWPAFPLVYRFGTKLVDSFIISFPRTTRTAPQLPSGERKAVTFQGWMEV